jgi:hypothetical protein
LTIYRFDGGEGGEEFAEEDERFLGFVCGGGGNKKRLVKWERMRGERRKRTVANLDEG